MLLVDVLNFVIDDGIEGLRQQCIGPDGQMRFEGGKAGFEACRGKEPGEIQDILANATARRLSAQDTEDPLYWHHRYYEAQVEYVASVMSAALVQLGLPPIAGVTARSMIRYAEIVGVDAR